MADTHVRLRSWVELIICKSFLNAFGFWSLRNGVMGAHSGYDVLQQRPNYVRNYIVNLTYSSIFVSVQQNENQ